MKLRFLQHSVVLLAEKHNPSILHPSFLASQAIVPPDWRDKGDTISTPFFSVVKYEGGYEFTAQQERLELKHTNPPEPATESTLPAIIEKYVKTLPHVKYTAVGINFVGGIVHPQPDRILMDKFLKPDGWDQLGLKKAFWDLQFKLDEALLDLKVASGGYELPNTGQRKEAIIVQSNYHINTPVESTLEAVIQAINRFWVFADDFANRASTIFKLGDR